MQLTPQEKMKRVEIAADLFKYAEMMYDMSRNPQILIKNIFRQKEKQNKQNLYSQEKFGQIKKHHYFSTVTAAFSFINDEYLTNLSLKNIGIDENTLTGIFVNKEDVNKYRNPMTGKVKDHEIIKYIRNALNHHENGILYKYIEEENAIEIDLKDVRTVKEKEQQPNKEPKRFHIKISVSLLLNIIIKLAETEQRKSNFILRDSEVNYDSSELKEELKNNLQLLRITTKKSSIAKRKLETILKLKNKEEQNRQLEQMEKDNQIEIREYSYQNGAITDWQIDSMYEIIKSSGEDDFRVKEMNNILSYVNATKSGKGLVENVNVKLSRWLAIRNIFQFGIITSDRFLSSALFDKAYLKSWNNSFIKSIEKEISETSNLKDLSRFEWFMLDPLEKIFTEYENFIRYAIVNFAPTPPEHIVTYNGKNYDCDFLRNSFAHGRVSYVRKNNQYMLALYDCKNGLHNEVTYVNKKMYLPIELVRFAEYLCTEEKKKIEKENQVLEEEKRKLIALRQQLTTRYDVKNQSNIIPLKPRKK